MTIHLTLKPEMEARLIAQAAARGISVEQYLESLIEERLAIQEEPEWQAILRELGKSPSLTVAPLLSDEAMSRESIYREREDEQR